MKRSGKKLALALVLLMLLTACGQTATQEATETETAASVETEAPVAEIGETPVDIKVTGQNVELTLDRAAYEATGEQTLRTSHVDSKGETTEVEITGIVLKEYLMANGIDFDSVAAINLVAADGYQISVERSMWEDADLMVITKIDGDELESARSALPGKRAMFWVKDLSEIQLDESGTAEEETQVSRVLIVREAVREMEAEKENNFGYEVDAYSLEELFETYLDKPEQPVKMIAKDGLEKSETADVFLDQYVSFEFEEGTEDDTPLYFSEDLSDGMRVKFLDRVTTGSDALFFGEEVELQQLLADIGMKEADMYALTAIDGFRVEVPAESIAFGKIVPDEEGFLKTAFEGYDMSDIKGKGSIKNILTIEAVGESADTGDTSAVGTTLLKVFVGDEKKELTEDEFNALPQIEKHLARTNSKGETFEGDYKGVHWNDLAEKLGIDPDTAVTLVASDGYEVKLTPDIMTDPDSLFAMEENGAPIESEGDGRIWFCASENFTANYWVKYVTKIVTE